MVQSSERRNNNYTNKNDADVTAKRFSAQKESMDKQQIVTSSNAVQVEQRIKSLIEKFGVPSIQIPAYLNLARKLAKINAHFKNLRMKESTTQISFNAIATTGLFEGSLQTIQTIKQGLDINILDELASLFKIEIFDQGFYDNYEKYPMIFDGYNLKITFPDFYEADIQSDALATSFWSPNGQQQDPAFVNVGGVFPHKLKFTKIILTGNNKGIIEQNLKLQLVEGEDILLELPILSNDVTFHKLYDSIVVDTDQTVAWKLINPSATLQLFARLIIFTKEVV